MTDSGKCKLCGGVVVNGICLDCRGSDYRSSETLEMEGIPLIEMPKVEAICEDDSLPPMQEPEPEKPQKSPDRDNPYSSVINYEDPEYGDNYTPPPQQSFGDESEQTLTQLMDFKPERSMKSYWWIFLISVIVPSPLTIAIGAALNIFDEKNGKMAGKIILFIGFFKSFFIEKKFI